MHHAQIVEEDHVAGLELDLGRVFRGGVMQGVEGSPLDGCEGWQGGGAGSRGRAGDASARAVDEDSAQEVIWESDGPGVEGPRGRRALKTDVSVHLTS